MSDRRNFNLAVAFVLSGALHALVLSGVGPGAGEFMSGTVPAPSPQGRRLTVTLPDLTALALSRQRISLLPPPSRIVEPSLPEVQPAGRESPAETAPILPLNIPDERYYTAQEVDQRARPANPVELAIAEPLAASANGSGRVVIKLWIDKSGKVDKAEAVSSDMSQAITTDFLQAFTGTLFSPALHNGGPVRTLVVIEISYDPEE